MIETSLYTHIFCRGGSFYVYNSESGMFAKIPQQIFEAIYNRDYSIIDSDMIEYLLEKKKKIIVFSEEKYSYYNEQKIRFISSVCDRENMGLVIVPTTSCNFSCPYCFENKKTNKTITPDIEEELISFIRSHKSIKYIDLTWYGGEPLLAFPHIVNIYNRIEKEVNAKIKKHSIITNGYLINDDVIDFFKKSKMNNIQITLDGTQENHNSLRFVKGININTYEVILDNIVKTAKALPDKHIYIRININKTNEGDYLEMYNFFAKDIKLENIFVYPGFIREETSDGCSFCYKSIDSNYIGLFYNKLMEHGDEFRTLPQKLAKGCMINKLNSYIIGPMGEIYKCWNDVSNLSKIIGYITDNKIKNGTLFGKYMNDVSPYSDEYCKECKVFPICSGECGWYKYKNKFENGNFNTCSQYKDLSFLEDVLLMKGKS